MAYTLLPTSDPDTTISIHNGEPMDENSVYFPRCCPLHYICYICELLAKCGICKLSDRRCLFKFRRSCRNFNDWIVNKWRFFRASINQKRYLNDGEQSININEQTNEQLEKENERLQQLNRKLQEQIEEYMRGNERLKEDHEDLCKRIEKLENDLEVANENNLRWYDQVRNLQKSNSLLAKNYEQEKEEKEKALTRLSSVAGDRLRFNNPAIADLSDENRPNKLAEKFSELYDNEWTEFYENLEETGSEEEIIGQIVQLLQDAFNTCNRLAENQRRLLTNVIEYPANQISDKTASPPEEVLSKVIDFQKRNATAAFKNVEKEILEKCAPLKENNSKAKYRFVERCSQLCWMMAIQDPPMYLEFGPNKDSVIDKNVFRLYTKSGEKVDFVVWPAVFLHQNGPIVQKGVLQPQ